MGSNLSRMTDLVTVSRFYIKKVEWGTEPERPPPLHLSSILLLTDEETQLLSGKAIDQRFIVYLVELYAFERSFVLLGETTKSQIDTSTKSDRFGRNLNIDTHERPGLINKEMITISISDINGIEPRRSVFRGEFFG